MADPQLLLKDMDKKQAGQRLMQLATGDDHRSKTARLRDIYEEVEVAIQAGVHQVAILAELKSLGLEMSPATFKSALQRIRGQKVAPPPSTAQAAPTPSPPAQPDPFSAPSPLTGGKTLEPGDLRAIARNRPNLTELARLGREANRAKALKAKDDKP